MLRTRERNLTANLPGWYGEEVEVYDDDLQKWKPYYFNKNSWLLPHHYTETITDIDSFIAKRDRPKGKFRGVNPVDHTVLKAVDGESLDTNWETFHVYPYTYRRRFRYGGYTNQASYVVQAYGLPDYWVDLSRLPHKEGADYLNNEGMSTEMSLLNFVTELPEIRTLFNFVLDRGLRKISGGLLSYSFGIQPLKGDLITLAAWSASFEKRLKWLTDNANKEVELTFRKRLSKPEGYIPIANGLRWRVLEWSHHYNAFARVKLDELPVNYCYQKLKHFNQYFGTTKLFTALWEGLPGSFVLDWFTNFGALIGQLDLPDKLSPRLFGIGYQQKLTARLALEYQLPGQIQQLGAYTFKKYMRQPGLPLSLDQVVDFHLPTGMQQGLLFTLIHQKW